MFLKPRATLETDDEDYDDSPLFTRASSYKHMKQNVSNSRSHESVPICRRPYPKYRLSFLESHLVASVLEDVLIQLRMLDICNNELRLHKTQTDMPSLKRHKYGVVLKPVSDELKYSDPSDFTAECHKLDKLVADRKFCCDVLKTTYLELALMSSYAPLVKARLANEERENNHNWLLAEEARNRIARREIAKNLRHHRIRMKAAKYESELTVTNLIRQVEDATLVKATRERYIDKWQGARTEQHNYSIQSKECTPSENTTMYRKKLDDEQRIHHELEALNSIRLNEILQEVDVWMDKYDKDVEAIELRIQLKQVDLDAQVAIREEMEARLVEHEEAINKWVNFKEERERQRLYNKRMTEAATAVQAWWRGLLVRLELGPYKPIRGPPKKEKEKDKKKKK